MKAIVLTYDPQIDLADLLVRGYDRLLVDRIFEFLIPINASRERGSFGGDQRVSFVMCDSDIRSTMTALLRDIPDEEWVYWAIDDRFPVWLDREAFLLIFEAIRRGDCDHVDGIKLIHWREQLTDIELRLGEHCFKRQKPMEVFGFYHHQFLRAGILRKFFVESVRAGVPATLYGLHNHFLEAGKRGFLDNIFVPASGNIAQFDEPLIGRALTRNGVKALQQYGCAIPDYPIKNVAAGFRDFERQYSTNPKQPKHLGEKDW